MTGDLGTSPVDITGEWLILRYHNTNDSSLLPEVASIDQIRFAQDGSTFTQFFGPDDDVGFDGTIEADGTYLQTDGTFTARLRFPDENHGSGTFEQGAFTTIFEFVRVGAPSYDVGGEWIVDDGSDPLQTVEVSPNGADYNLIYDDSVYNGRIGFDVGFFLPEAQPADGSVAVRVDWTSDGDATLTFYESSWTPAGGGHTDFTTSDTELTLARRRVKGSPCAADAQCPGELFCARGICQDGATGDFCDDQADCLDQNELCDSVCRVRVERDACGPEDFCPDGLYCGEAQCWPGDGPTDCQLSEWTVWSECDARCGGGEQMRERYGSIDATPGGAPCPHREETQACNEHTCATASTLYAALYDGGAFVQLNSVDWVENNVDGVKEYTETGRSDSVVTLERLDGFYRIEIDVPAEAIRVVEVEGGALATSYEMIDSNPASDNGWSATRAYHDGGGFVQINANTWVQDRAGAYEQTLRDPWTVYFAFNVLNFLNLQFRERAGDALFPITNVGPDDEINVWVMREVLFEGGRFVQTEPELWTYYDGETAYVMEQQDSFDITDTRLYIYTTGEPDDNFEINLTDGVVRSLSAGAPDRAILDVR